MHEAMFWMGVLLIAALLIWKSNQNDNGNENLES